MYHVKKHTEIIRIQSQLLLESNQTYLNPAQRDLISRVSRYAAQLVLIAQKPIHTSDQAIELRHDLINVLTPIMGYVEMMADGWMGNLNPDQVSHVELIQHCVGELRLMIVSQSHNYIFTESA